MTKLTLMLTLDDPHNN